MLVAIAAKAEQASKSADALAVLRDHINGPAVPGWQARLVKKAADLTTYCSGHAVSRTASRMCAVPCASWQAKAQTITKRTQGYWEEKAR